MTTTLALLLVPAVALVLTAGLTPVVRGAALATGRVTAVRQDRWHERPTPNLGGVAIFLGFGAAILVGTLAAPDTVAVLAGHAHDGVGLTHWEALLGAGIVAFLLGLTDDLVRLRPVAKLVGQLVAATLLVVGGIGLELTGIHVLDVGLSLVWFVGITNALNLLDNMDGLAAGTGAIAAGVLAVLFVMDGALGLAALALGLAGALVGFLAHNYPPARIFMGDSGSLFLGIFLSGLALSPAPGLSRGLFGVMAVPVLVLSVPLFDTTFVTVNRLLEGRSPIEGGRDHTSHRLAALGMGEEGAVWTLWTLALLGGGVSLLFRTAERALAGVVGGVLLLFLALVGAYVLVSRHRDEAAAVGSADHLDHPPDGGDEAAAVDLVRTLFAFHDRVPLLAFVMDLLLVGLAYYGAYLIRWDPPALGTELDYFRSSLPLVLASKIVVFVWVGIYDARWRHFGLEDSLRVVRANLFASVLTAAVLLLVQRVGLSRGVLIVDFFLCSALVAGARFSFRFLEGISDRLSKEGTGVVVVGPLSDAELAVRELRLRRTPSLRPVAVAAPDYGPPRGTIRGLPVFGGRGAVTEAVRSTGAHAVVVVERCERERSGGLPAELEAHLRREGALDVYQLRIELDRLGTDGGTGAASGGAEREDLPPESLAP